MKYLSCFFVAILFVITACKQKQEQTVAVNHPAPEETIKAIAPLEKGEIFYKNKEPFGTIINLTGQQLIADTVIFKPRETRMLVKGNQLIVKNLDQYMFMRFLLPDMKFLGYSGRSGQGPDEFSYPSLVPATDTTVLCYIFELPNQKLYKFGKEGTVERDSFRFSKAERWGGFSDKEIVNIAPDDFLYVETNNTGKSIFRTTKTGDSTTIREIYKLGLSPNLKSGFSYIGDFVVNAKQNRMAYAYKYFKIIKFMDLEAQTVRTINFEREEFDESSLHITNGLDQNVTHYWGACAGDDFVYFLYSGRTPVEVMRENNKKQYYIYVEQYDWNGNPVHKYKLDRWGYFTVDEKNKLIYLVSTNDDDPFFTFSLADRGQH